MSGSLRSRLILSHVLPLMLIIPLMGVALIYVLERQVLLADTFRQLTSQARLVAEIARSDPNIWQDRAAAQLFVNRVRPTVAGQLMLLDPTGQVLASGTVFDLAAPGQRLELPGLPAALNGSNSAELYYSQNLGSDIADILVPVAGPSGQVLGMVRLTDQLATITERFLSLRVFTVQVLATGLYVGSMIGWFLAVNLGRPLQRITEGVNQLASGQRLTPLPETGPVEIRQLLHAVNSLAERLRTLEEARRRLLANLVHELTNPLGAVGSALQALLRGADQDPGLRRELLVGMEAEIQRMGRLVDDLADLHDRVMGTFELNRRPIALRDWLLRGFAPWHESARQAGLTFKTEIAPELPTVEVDPDRLAQALGNLLSNAIKYTPPGGNILVQAAVEGDALCLRVSDTGPGIPPEELEQIFTPYYRGRSQQRFSQGMGLGLSIAYDLVVAHGGDLIVESTPGAGSDFTIRLPLPHEPI